MRRLTRSMMENKNRGDYIAYILIASEEPGISICLELSSLTYNILCISHKTTIFLL